MGILAIWAMFSGLILSSAFIGGDDEAMAEEDIDPNVDTDTVTEDPDIMLDTGASFEQTENGVTLELGDDETGTLAVIHYSEIDAHDGLETQEARFYLVPEGVDWSGASLETRYEVPGADTFDDDATDYDLAAFEGQFGLELLGTVDLLGVGYVFDDNGSITEDPNDRIGEITSNAPFETYLIRSLNDSDQVVSFLPASALFRHGGVDEVPVFEDATGTDGVDWLSADADGITVDAAGGDDYLETDNSNVTLVGGQGDDHIVFGGSDVNVDAGEGDDEIYGSERSFAENIDGGAGDDIITLYSGTAHGGEGDDSLRGFHNADTGPGILYGDAGNDYVSARGNGSHAFGGAGNDDILLRDGAVGYGGAGDDSLHVINGSTAFGGDGDDLIKVTNLLSDPDGPIIVTGGDGADTFQAKVYGVRDGDADTIFMRVTDFDPAEDILQIGTFWSLDEVDSFEIVEAADSSYTDVRVTYADAPSIPVVIRLDGTTGVTADQIVITN